MFMPLKYAAKKGLSKREIWIEVVREGMKALKISSLACG